MSKNKQMSEDTKNLVNKAMRSDQRVQAEDLVANELATAVLSEPMSKIRHTCEALMLLGENEKNAAGINEKEVEKVNEIYDLCITFENTHIDKVVWSNKNVKENYAELYWPFEIEDMEYYYKNYLGVARISWYADVRQEWREKKKELEENENIDKYEMKYELSEGHLLSMATWKRLRANFTTSAMPSTGKLLKKIIQVVSSSSFQAAMDRLKGGSQGGKKGKS